MEGTSAFALNLAVLERRAIAHTQFGDGIRKVRGVAERHVALDHRCLRVPVDHDQVARMHHRLGGVRVRHEQQMDRPSHRHVLGNVQHDTVRHERRVELCERVLFGVAQD